MQLARNDFIKECWELEETKSVEAADLWGNKNNTKNQTLCFFFPVSFEEYLKEERACRQEVNAYEKKIENWSHHVKAIPKLPAASNIKVFSFLFFFCLSIKKTDVGLNASCFL